MVHLRGGALEVKDTAVTSRPSIWLAEHEGERQDKLLTTLILAYVQNPITPILKAVPIGEGLHDAGPFIARFGKIVRDCTAVIDENLIRVGAVEIHLSHIQPPSNGTGSNETAGPLAFATVRHEGQIR